MISVFHGHVDATLLLLSMGSNVHATDLYHRTAMHRGVSEIGKSVTYTLYNFLNGSIASISRREIDSLEINFNCITLKCIHCPLPKTYILEGVVLWSRLRTVERSVSMLSSITLGMWRCVTCVVALRCTWLLCVATWGCSAPCFR